MTARPAPERGGEAVPVDPIGQLLSEFDVDAMAVIDALLGEVSRLERELALMRPVVSPGFSRAGITIDGRAMPRRSAQRVPSPTRIDREFPHQVALPDDLCVDRNFSRIYDFCKGFGVEWHTRQVIAIWPNGKHENHRLHCFAEVARAEAFQAHFGGVMFDPRRDRQGGIAKGAWKRNEPWRRVVRNGPLLVPLALVDAEGPYSRLP